MENTDSLAVITRRMNSARKMRRSAPAQGHDALNHHLDASDSLGAWKTRKQPIGLIVVLPFGNKPFGGPSCG